MPTLPKIFFKRSLQWSLWIVGAVCVIYWGVTAITGRGIRLTTHFGWTPCVVWVRESTGSLESFDFTQPFRVVLARGSGWHGFDTMDIDSQGGVILFRMWRTYSNPDVAQKMARWMPESTWVPEAMKSGWETTTLHLTSAQIRQVGKVLSRYGIGRLKNSYSAAGVKDGTQWVLRVFQSGQWKAAYFDNYFPDASRELADGLDRILRESVLPMEKWEWVQVSQEEWRKHEKVLYDVQPGMTNF